MGWAFIGNYLDDVVEIKHKDLMAKFSEQQLQPAEKQERNKTKSISGRQTTTEYEKWKQENVNDIKSLHFLVT